MAEFNAKIAAANALTTWDYPWTYGPSAAVPVGAPLANVFFCNPETNVPNMILLNVDRQLLVDDYDQFQKDAFGQVIYIDAIPPVPILKKDVTPYEWYAIYIVEDAPNSGTILYEDHCGFTSDQSFSGQWITTPEGQTYNGTPGGGWSSVDDYFDQILSECEMMVDSPESNWSGVTKAHVVARMLYPNPSTSFSYPSYFTLESTSPPYLTNVVESSLLMKNGQEWVYYDYGAQGDFDLTINNGVGQTLDTQHGRFLNVFWVGSVLYEIYIQSDGAYCRTSTDGLTWGSPYKILSIVPGTIFANVWNVTPAQGPDRTWIVLVECSETGAENPSLVELQSDIVSDTIPDFTPQQTASVFTTISMAGNAWVQYVTGKGWLMLCGQIFDGFWVTVAYTKMAASDFWEKKNFLVAQPGIHICDPSLTDGTLHGLSLLVSYNQNEVLRLDSSLTMAEFYDTIQ